MPTNDERRDVAARLRNYENLRESFRESPICAFLDALVVEYLDWKGVCNRLADLIEQEPERTCHKELMIWFSPATELTSEYEVEYFGCSECGEWLSDTDCYGLDDGPNYCDNCGYKVDKSFITDECTGEVIYRDGAKVVR